MVIGQGIILIIGWRQKISTGLGADHFPGLHGKAIGYPTPFDAGLSPEEEFIIINPTIRLMGVVSV